MTTSGSGPCSTPSRARPAGPSTPICSGWAWRGWPSGGRRRTGRCWRTCGGSTPSRRRPSPGSPPSVRASQPALAVVPAGPGGPRPGGPLGEGVLDDLTFPVDCSEEELTVPDGGPPPQVVPPGPAERHRPAVGRLCRPGHLPQGQKAKRPGERQCPAPPGGARRRAGGGGGPGSASGRKISFSAWARVRPGSRFCGEYVENCFGVSMFPPSETAAAEKALCTGKPQELPPHFTKGVLPTRNVSKETAWERDMFQRQREKNREYYQARLVQNQHILLPAGPAAAKHHPAPVGRHRQPYPGGDSPAPPGLAGGRSSGRPGVCPAAAERAGGPVGDILLDASASQNQQQRSYLLRPISSPPPSPGVRSRCGCPPSAR